MKKDCINCQKPIESKKPLHCPGCNFGPICNECYKKFSIPIMVAQEKMLKALLKIAKTFSQTADEFEKLQNVMKEIILNDE